MNIWLIASPRIVRREVRVSLKNAVDCQWTIAISKEFGVFS